MAAYFNTYIHRSAYTKKPKNKLKIFPYEKSTHMHECFSFNWQFSILPGRFHPSTFDVQVLNYCVRYGNRWVHLAITTRYSFF